MLLFVQLSLIFCISTIPLSKGQAKECLPAKDVSPCTCEKLSYSDDLVILSCRQIIPIADIRRVMEKMLKLQIQAFSLENYQSEDPLPAEFFQGLTVQRIWIIDSSFSFAPKRYPFEGLEDSLLSLHLDKSHVGFPLISLSHLKKLKVLTINEVEVKTLETYWSEQHLPQDLEELMMANCDITSMDRYSLTALHKLKSLSIFNNRLSNFARNVLPNPLNDLRTLHLSYNLIRNLDKDFFEGMPSLREVYLRRNQILSMYWFTWEPVWYRLKVVDMLGNPLDCARNDLRWICNVKVPKEIYGSCVSPDKLQDVQIGSKEYCDLIGLR